MILLVNRMTGRVHREQSRERCNVDDSRRAGNIVEIEVQHLRDGLAGRRRRRLCAWCFPKRSEQERENNGVPE